MIAQIVIPFLIIILLVLLNGLFVAAEFAIIGVRPSRVEQLAGEGNRTASRIVEIIRDPRRTDRYIATAQLGITLASLGLGMYAEPAIAHLIEEPLHSWFGLEGAIVHTISFIVALSLVTYLHVVVGEMVPKSLALQSAERTVLVLSAPMSLAGRLFSLPVTVLNGIGVALLNLFNVPPPGDGSRGYSPDELEMIVSESYLGGLVEQGEQELVAGIFDFTERRVGQVMTPRTVVEAIPLDIEEEALLELMVTSPQSRLPVFEGSIENIIGIIHLKDVVRHELSDDAFDLSSLLRKCPFVPETLPIDSLLASFKRLHQHMAIVIDEHGSMVGLVTLEDLIEEVFGEVRDEFDSDEKEPIVVVQPGYVRANGRVLIDEIDEFVPIGEHDFDVETVGGLLLATLSRRPQEGDEATIAGLRLVAEQVNGLAIELVGVYFDPAKAHESIEH